MQFTLLLHVVLGVSLVAAEPMTDAEVEACRMINVADSQIRAGELEQALATMNRAVELAPRFPNAYHWRAAVHQQLGHHEEAIADFNRVLAVGPDLAEVYDARGSEQFKLGHVTAAIQNFDRAVELDPKLKRQHWRRGIAYYYAGRYEEGRQQFEDYQAFDDSDVENAVWRFLCMAREDGLEAARNALLEIKHDRRPWAAAVYGLFAGTLEPEELLAAAEEDLPPARPRSERLFYANLYVGLYYEAIGEDEKSLEHVERAARDYRIDHYMGDVAAVHVMLRRAKPQEKK